MRVRFADLLDAMQYASLGGVGEHQAFLCRESGKIHLHSEFGDNFEELPDDIEDGEKYIGLPDKRELDLGKPLVLDFVSEFMPDDFDDVRQIFVRKGAYARFKGLLHRKGKLQQWYDFETKAEEKALRQWCEDNSIELSD
jgi:hypothetical protein